MIPPPPRPTLFPYTTLFRSWADRPPGRARDRVHAAESAQLVQPPDRAAGAIEHRPPAADGLRDPHLRWPADLRATTGSRGAGRRTRAAGRAGPIQRRA